MTRFQREFFMFAAFFALLVFTAVIIYLITNDSYAGELVKFICMYIIYRIGWNFGFDDGCKHSSKYIINSFKAGIKYNLRLVKDFFFAMNDRATYEKFLTYSLEATKEEEEENEHEE